MGGMKFRRNKKKKQKKTENNNLSTHKSGSANTETLGREAKNPELIKTDFID